MTATGLNAISGSFNKFKDNEEKLIIAQDILKALKTNKQAWKTFRIFAEGYKRVRIGFIESRRHMAMRYSRKA